MKKIICIDDKQEELVHAAVAVRTSGYTFQQFLIPEMASVDEILSEIENADGVITDLHFLPKEEIGWKYNELPPAGLLVVMHCLAHNVPVVICTDVYHHDAAASWIYDGYGFTSTCPFGWNDKKDWKAATEMLERMMEK